MNTANGPKKAEAAADLSPSGLVLARWRAFREGRFGFIWDSAHPESAFRQAFPDRATYRDYGRQGLAAAFEFFDCRVLAEDARGRLARVLIWQRFSCRGEEQCWFEWIRLRRDQSGWCIYQTARLEAHRYPGRIEAFDWKDFESLGDGEFF